MKKNFSQLAQAYRYHALAESDCRAVLQWFEAPSLYFPAQQDALRAFDALSWLDQAVKDHPALLSGTQAQEQCTAAFSATFSLPAQSASRLFRNFLRWFDAPQPVIIGIEGLDGSGKTVQANKLSAALEQSGSRVCLIDFPQYGSFFGKEIGGLLSGRDSTSALDLDEKSMCLWYALDRWNAMRPLRLEDYDYVIFNRYTLSNVVYQSARKYNGFHQEFADWVFSLEHTQLALPVPDLYLYLDTKSDLCGENVLKKGGRDYTDGLDVYESYQALLRCCHGIYRTLAGKIPEIKILDCMDGRGNLKTVEAVGAEILLCLKDMHISP